MKYRGLIPAGLLALFISACSTTGPVRFYQGPPKPADQLAIVIVPAPITVLSIDGRSVESPSRESGTYQLQLPPGYHLIAFRYELYWGTEESGSMVRSRQVGVDAVFDAGSTYTLKYKVPHSKDEAEALASNFSSTLVNDQTKQIHTSYDVDNPAAVLAARKMSNGQAQVNQTVKATSNEAANMTSQADKAVSQDPVKRLKFWWLMSNQQQRKEFTDWMKGASESFAPSQDNSQPDVAPDTINGVKLKP